LYIAVIYASMYMYTCRHLFLYASLCIVSNELRSGATIQLQQLTDTTARLVVRFSNYDVFTGGAQNFTINVRKTVYLHTCTYEIAACHIIVQ